MKIKMKNSDCLIDSLSVLSWTGVWLPDAFMEYPKRYFFITFAAFIQGLIYFSMVLAEIAHLFLIFGDEGKTLDAAVLLLSHLVQGAKVTTIWCRRHRIQRLIDIIDAPDFTKADNPTERAFLAKTVKQTRRLGQVMLLSTAFTAVIWSGLPILRGLKKTLPLKTAYPFDISTSPTFEVMYLYSSISVSLVAVGDAAENFLVAALLILVGSKLDLLRRELEQFGKNRKQNQNSYEYAVACVKYHQRIIKCVEEMNRIFGLPILCQFGTSTLVLCITVFKIRQTDEPLEVVTLVFYLMLIFLELMLYCYPGDRLLNKSLLVAEAAYFGDWVNCEPNTRHAIRLMILRSQKPLTITAGGVYEVSLPTAAAIFQTSYSYYAVLKQRQL